MVISIREFVVAFSEEHELAEVVIGSEVTLRDRDTIHVPVPGLLGEATVAVVAIFQTALEAADGVCEGRAVGAPTRGRAGRFGFVHAFAVATVRVTRSASVAPVIVQALLLAAATALDGLVHDRITDGVAGDARAPGLQFAGGVSAAAEGSRLAQRRIRRRRGR